MKKFNVSFAMLALALVFVATALAFAGCSSDTDAPKTMEGLYNELKGFNVGELYIWKDGFETSVDWCSTHKAWEPWQNGVGLVHGGTPAFSFADASGLGGGFSTTQNDANAAVAKDIIKKLDSFFEDPYKLGTTYDTYEEAAGTEFIVWYDFYLNDNGYGGYGSSAVPAVAPFKMNEYKF